jgi:hypothetical protein
MSFGVQNLGVIDQRGTPAIWQSDYVDFPNNFIEGRILIATGSGGIYLDTNTNRLIISSGTTLLQTYNIDLDGNDLTLLNGTVAMNTMAVDVATISQIDNSNVPTSYIGTNTQIDFLATGSIYRSGGTLDGEFPSMQEDGIGLPIPNISLKLKLANGDTYNFSARKN